MKIKKIVIFTLMILGVFVCFLINKSTYSNVVGDNINFDYTINVDEENGIIKYLAEDTTVFELLGKVESNVSDYNLIVNDSTGNEKTNGKILTGDKLVLKDASDNIVDEYVLSVLGDVTGGYGVNGSDVGRLFEYYKGKRELDEQYLLAGDVKFNNGNTLSVNDEIELSIGDSYVLDYVVLPDDDYEITLADIAKLYQYTLGKVELDYYSSNDVGSIEWSKNENVEQFSLEDGVVKAKNSGQATVKATYKFSDDSNYSTIEDITTVIVKNPNLILDSQFLTTDGNEIVRNGNTIQLKGYNLGAWLSRSTTFLPIQAMPECRFNDCSHYKVDDKVSTSDIDEAAIGLEKYNACISECSLNEINMYSCINNESIEESIYYNMSLKTDTLDDEYDIDTLMSTKSLSNVLYENYITESDFDMIAQSGANLIRLPFEFNLFMTDYDKDGVYTIKDSDDLEDVFVLFDWAISQAKKRGIYVILDLHVAPGRQNDGGYCEKYKFLANSIATSDGERRYTDDEVSDASANRDEIVKMWSMIAERYSSESAVAGYDLLNEPQANQISRPDEYEVLIDFYDDAYDAIRAVDDKHIIIMEETCVYCGYSVDDENDSRNNYQYLVGGLPNPSDKEWTNVVYSTHDYFEDKKSNGKSIAEKLETDENGNYVIDSAGDYVWTEQATYVSELKNRFDERFLRTVKKVVIDYNIPLFIGEFSYLGNNASWNGNDGNGTLASGSSKALWEYAFNAYNGNFNNSSLTVGLDINGDGKGSECKIYDTDTSGQCDTIITGADIIGKYANSISYTAWTYKGNWDPYWALVYYSNNTAYISNTDLNNSENEEVVNSLDALNDDCSNASDAVYHLVYDITEKVLLNLDEKSLCKIRKGLIKSVSGVPYKVDLENDSIDTIEKVFKYSSSGAMKFNKNFYTLFLNQFGKTRVADEITLFPLASNNTFNDDSECSVILDIGESTKLNYKINNTKTINKKVIWGVTVDDSDSNSNLDVLKIDSLTGKITALSSGTALVTATVIPYEYVLSDFDESIDEDINGLKITGECKIVVK